MLQVTSFENLPMRTLLRWYGCIVVAVALFGPATARANIITYVASDPGVGPGGARPNSDAQAALFDAAVSGKDVQEQIITFEGLPLNQPGTDGTALTVSKGVTMSLTGTQHVPPSGNAYGISNVSSDALTGYNTTPGGSQFIKFVPMFGVGTAKVQFSYNLPIEGFGAYITGLSTISGPLHVLFSDSSGLHDLSFTGLPAGGVQFIGFTDKGARIHGVTLALTQVVGNQRDVFGIDDVRAFVDVPEPMSALLVGTGLFGLLLFGRRPGRA